MAGKNVKIEFARGEQAKEELFLAEDDGVRKKVLASLAENTAGPVLASVYGRYRRNKVSIFVQLAAPAQNDGYVEVHYWEIGRQNE